MTKENKFAVGTQWKTRGGWRAVVVNNSMLDGFWCWHGNPNTTQPHHKDGRGHYNKGDYDLIEPWTEPRVFEIVIEVRRDGSVTLENDGYIFDQCSLENPIARKKITITEGEGMDE